MKKKIKDTAMPIGELTRIDDFLPPPEKLVFPQKTIKITLTLDESSVQFFKSQAKKNHTKYQKLLRELLHRYTLYYS